MGVMNVVRSRVAEAVQVLGGKTAPPPGVSWEAPAVVTQFGNVEWQVDIASVLSTDPAQLWRDQPNLRAVVNFLARNVAQLRIFVFDRVSDTDRQRISEGPAFDLLKYPNPKQTQYELINALVSQVALWDDSYLWLVPDTRRPSGFRAELLPPQYVQADWTREVYVVQRVQRSGSDGTSTTRQTEVPMDQVIHFHGWSPLYEDSGTSPIAALRDVLAEQIAAVGYRQQRWRNGARVGTYLWRPPNAPAWSDAAQERFAQEWRDKWSANTGTDAGGEPLLQDGMELRKLGFTAVEDEYIDAAKLTLTTVASVYHVNPVMVGLLDNANYSNVREFRRMLYGDTLGPWLTMIEDRLNSFLLPALGMPSTAYCEFNVAEKLQGSFEEQASVMSTMVGRPIMTANEGRARFNLPAVDDPTADELITPMNVTVGGQPSPQTPLVEPAPAPPPGEPPPESLLYRPVRAPAGRSLPAAGGNGTRRKARATDADHRTLERAITGFLDRQQRSVLSEMGRTRKRRDTSAWQWPQRKADGEEPPAWWNGDRWNAELARIVKADAMSVSGRIGGDIYPDYSTEQTDAYLTKFARIRAENINATTLAELETAVAEEDDEDEDEEATTPEDVFTRAKEERAPVMATTLLTAVAGFASTEAGKQSGGGTKTWVVTSGNSRHPQMDGETVPVDDAFSNGAQWPGDPDLGADETVGCLCDLIINIA